MATVPERKLFIAGKWVPPALGGTLDVVNPATEAVFARIPAATAEDVNVAVEAALAAFKSGHWSKAKAAYRATFLKAIAQKARDQLPAKGASAVIGLNRGGDAERERPPTPLRAGSRQEERAGQAGDDGACPAASPARRGLHGRMSPDSRSPCPNSPTYGTPIPSAAQDCGKPIDEAEWDMVGRTGGEPPCPPALPAPLPPYPPLH
jgi:hypothetical protein